MKGKTGIHFWIQKRTVNSLEIHLSYSHRLYSKVYYRIQFFKILLISGSTK